MGRNRKVGLDWWPRDIGLYRDPKLRAARQKIRRARAVCVRMPARHSYGDKGYYIAYSGEGREDTLWQLREYTAGLENVTIETLAAVVDQLVASGLFHAALYERGFLTSKRIQMGYFLATVTRNAVPINLTFGFSPSRKCGRRIRVASLLCCVHLFPARKMRFIVRKMRFIVPKIHRAEKSREQKSREQ